MRSAYVYLEKLELLCTNNKLTFRYIMKNGTNLSASLILQNKFRVFKMRSHLREKQKEISLFISIFSHHYLFTSLRGPSFQRISQRRK